MVGLQMRRSGVVLQYGSRISPGLLMNAIFISELIKIIEFFQQLIKRHLPTPTLSMDLNKWESGHLIRTYSILCKSITTRNKSSSAARLLIHHQSLLLRNKITVQNFDHLLASPPDTPSRLMEVRNRLHTELIQSRAHSAILSE
jgi:hypothetical protein